MNFDLIKWYGLFIASFVLFGIQIYIAINFGWIALLFCIIYPFYIYFVKLTVDLK